jgi:hypothetical protein
MLPIQTLDAKLSCFVGEERNSKLRQHAPELCVSGEQAAVGAQ